MATAPSKKFVSGSVDPFVGSVIGTLGEGTYGVVKQYRVGATNYAVKLSKTDPGMFEIRSSDLREASTSKAMRHPNVISLVSYGFTTNGAVFMTMNMAAGTLKNRIDAGMHSPERLNFTYQLLCGSDYLLANNVLHRDLKPQNILIMGDGTLKITDFGLARALGCVTGTGKTQEVVTLWYRAPEVLLGGVYGDGIDKWAVGCILYEMFVGAVMFRGNGDLDMIAKMFADLGFPSHNEFVDLPMWGAVSSLDYLTPRDERHNLIPDVDLPEIKTMILDLLNYNQDLRPSMRTLYSSSIFDPFRNPAAEAYQFKTCIENLETRAPSVGENAWRLGVTERLMLKKWMFDTFLFYGGSPRCYFYAIDLIQACLTKRPDSHSASLLYACFWIAYAYTEMYVVGTPELTATSSGMFTVGELDAKIREVMAIMDFDLLRSTCYDLIIEYGQFYSSNPKILDVAKTVGVLYSLSPRYTTTSSKDIALISLLAGCVYTGSEFKHTPDLPRILENYEEFVKYMDKLTEIAIFPDTSKIAGLVNSEIYDTIKDKPVVVK